MREEDVEAVCRVAVDWKGDTTLGDLIAARYAPIRAELTEQRLARTLADHEDLIASWQGYSEDKRTSGGWALTHDEQWAVSQPFPKDGNRRERRFDDPAAACAAFVLAELEFWHLIDQPGDGA